MFLLLLPLLLISAATLAAAACSGDQDCEAEHYCYKMLCYSPHQIAQQAFNAGIVRQSCALTWCGVVWYNVVCCGLWWGVLLWYGIIRCGLWCDDNIQS